MPADQRTRSCRRRPRNLLAECWPPQRIEELDETGELNMGVPLWPAWALPLSAPCASAAPSRWCSASSRSTSRRWTRWAAARAGELILEKRGLILMVGATGSGKSTTLASMIEWRNQQITGTSSPSKTRSSSCSATRNPSSTSARSARHPVAADRPEERAAPGAGLILIGEIRDRETMTSAAIAYALSGHLCLATCTPTTATTRSTAS
jgi:twitching motility protein PilU